VGTSHHVQLNQRIASAMICPHPLTPHLPNVAGEHILINQRISSAMMASELQTCDEQRAALLETLDDLHGRVRSAQNRADAATAAAEESARDAAAAEERARVANERADRADKRANNLFEIDVDLDDLDIAEL
jgi:hypothetical protein